MEEVKLHLTDFVPKDWTTEGTSDVVIAIYQCVLTDRSLLGDTYLIQDIDQVRCIVLEGSLPILSADFEYQGIESGAPKFHTHVRQENTQNGIYTLLLTPHDEDSNHRIESAKGLVTALEGGNATYRHVVTEIFHPSTNQMTGYSNSMKVPNFDAVPFLAPHRIEMIAEKLKSQDIGVQNRVNLGLRWYSKGDDETDPLDEFLKTWFAIEVLFMPESSNIRLINDALMKIYDMDVNTVRDQFRIGRILDRRSKVVHEGLIPPIHGQLQKYLQALFVDLLYFLLDIESEKRAFTVLSETTFNRENWLP